MLRLSTTRSLTRGTLDISLIQNMNALPNFRRYGRIFRVAINLSSLENALEKLQPFAKLILVDPMNRVLVSSADGFEALLEFDAASLPQGHAILKQRLNRIPNLQLIGIYDKQLLSEGFSAILRHYTRLAASLSILGVVLATLMARTITMRLRGIGQIAQRIAQGDFSQLDLAMMGTDEVGQLAADVNQMSPSCRIISIWNMARAYVRQNFSGRRPVLSSMHCKVRWTPTLCSMPWKRSASRPALLAKLKLPA